MAYLRTVFALIACKEASLFGVDLCSCTPASTFYKLLEIERNLDRNGLDRHVALRSNFLMVHMRKKQAYSLRHASGAHNNTTARIPCLRVHTRHGSGVFLLAKRRRHCLPTSSQSKAATTFSPTNTGGCTGIKTPVSGSEARVVMPTAHSNTPTSSSSRLSHCWPCA